MDRAKKMMANVVQAVAADFRGEDITEDEIKKIRFINR